MRYYIVIFNNSGSKGGVERVNALLKRALERNGDVIEITSELLLPRRFRQGRLGIFLFAVVASLVVAWIKLTQKHAVVITNAYFTPFARTDVCIAHGCLKTFFTAASRVVSQSRMPLTPILERMTYTRANQVYAVSRDVSRSLVEHYRIPGDKVQVWHLGIDTRPLPKSRKFHLDKTRLGFAGRFEKTKGADYITDLILRIKEGDLYTFALATPTAVPHWFHDVSCVKVYNDLNPEMMGEFYSNIDVLILPSVSEGFELVTLEAICSGVCVLGNKVGAVGHFLDLGREFVRLLPFTPADLLLALPKLIDEFKAGHNCEEMRKFIERDYGLGNYTQLAEAISCRGKRNGGRGSYN